MEDKHGDTREFEPLAELDLTTFVGTWLYGTCDGKYQIHMGDKGKQLQFDEKHASGQCVSGALLPQGGWLFGDLIFLNGEVRGTIRLRLDAVDGTLVSNFRRPGKSQWGPELVAHKSATCLSVVVEHEDVSNEDLALAEVEEAVGDTPEEAAHLDQPPLPQLPQSGLSFSIDGDSQEEAVLVDDDARPQTRLSIDGTLELVSSSVMLETLQGPYDPAPRKPPSPRAFTSTRTTVETETLEADQTDAACARPSRSVCEGDNAHVKPSLSPHMPRRRTASNLPEIPTEFLVTQPQSLTSGAPPCEDGTPIAPSAVSVASSGSGEWPQGDAPSQVANCRELSDALEEIAKLKRLLNGSEQQRCELTRERDALTIELKESRIQTERSNVESEALRAQLRESHSKTTPGASQDGDDEGWAPVRRALRETSLRLKLASTSGCFTESSPA